MYLIRLPTTGTPRSSSSLTLSASARAFLSYPRFFIYLPSCALLYKRLTQSLFSEMTPRARGTRIFLYPVLVSAVLTLFRQSSRRVACKSQLIFRLRERLVLLAAINQATEFQFGATSRGHAENSHYETHVVNQWNRSPPCPKRKNVWGLYTAAMRSVMWRICICMYHAWRNRIMCKIIIRIFIYTYY